MLGCFLSIHSFYYEVNVLFFLSDLSLFPQLTTKVQGVAVRPYFALMLDILRAFVHGAFSRFFFNNSVSLSWPFCDCGKPGRAHVPPNSQPCVLHSTAEYASKVISNISSRKPC